MRPEILPPSSYSMRNLLFSGTPNPNLAVELQPVGFAVHPTLIQLKVDPESNRAAK
jgi:hypothetical protein